MSGRWVRGLQVALSAVAGFVDAIGFLSLDEVYVAFMSGNSTLVGIGAGSWTLARLPAAVVGCFVGGVVLGTLGGDLVSGARGGALGRFRPLAVLLALAALLAGAAWLCRSGRVLAGGLGLAVAMGLENTAFNRPGESGVGLTYMTGTLVRIGQGLAGALIGGRWRAVVPDLLLWLGLVAGAALGAVVFRRIGVDGLWVGVGAVLVVAGLSVRRAPGYGMA